MYTASQAFAMPGPQAPLGGGNLRTLQDLRDFYGGRWYNFGQKAGVEGDWFRAPRIDPVQRVVWNPQLGWQSWDKVRRLKGDYSGLTPQFGDVWDYFQRKATGTSDPELRAKYGSAWQQYLPGAGKSPMPGMPGPVTQELSMPYAYAQQAMPYQGLNYGMQKQQPKQQTTSTQMASLRQPYRGGYYAL